MLVKLGGKFHEKPSKGEEGLWRVAEMATKNAMFIGQPHTQRHLWRKRNGQKLDREVDSSKSLANSNTYLAHNRVQIFFEGSFLFILKKQLYIHTLWTFIEVIEKTLQQAAPVLLQLLKMGLASYGIID